MTNIKSTLSRLALVVSGALALGACSRANYATLPRTDAYLNTATAVSKPRPVTPVVEVTPVASVDEASASVAPKVAVAPATSAAISTPVAKAPAVAAVAQPAQVAPATLATAPAPKLNLVQRLALKKITKKLDKLAASTPQLKQHDATARGSSGISGNLRTGIILLLVGLLVGLLNALIGTIIAIIGLVFIILWLLDQA